MCSCLTEYKGNRVSLLYSRYSTQEIISSFRCGVYSWAKSCLKFKTLMSYVSKPEQTVQGVPLETWLLQATEEPHISQHLPVSPVVTLASPDVHAVVSFKHVSKNTLLVDDAVLSGSV